MCALFLVQAVPLKNLINRDTRKEAQIQFLLLFVKVKTVKSKMFTNKGLVT